MAHASKRADDFLARAGNGSGSEGYGGYRDLRTILERNLRVEFVIVPVHCLESEAVVRVAAEALLELREIYSATAFYRWGYSAQFALSAER